MNTNEVASTDKINEIDVQEIKSDEENTKINTLTASKKKKEKKHHQAIALVEQAKRLVKETEDQNTACKLLLEEDLKEYDAAKESLKDGGLDACTVLLEKLGDPTALQDQSNEENIIVFEPKEEVAPIRLKNVSSGKFTGLLYALIGGVATAGGLIYLASEKLGTSIDINKIPSEETMEKTASWFSTALGLDADVYVGTAILAAASLGVMALIYSIRVGLKGRTNFHFASKQLNAAEEYTKKKSDCKTQMDKVDAHIKETVTTLKMYEVLFNEQKGKLERILHIEGSKEKSSEYHEKSFLEIYETKELIKCIDDFMSTPMSKEGRLSEISVQYLQSAKSKMDKMIERLY